MLLVREREHELGKRLVDVAVDVLEPGQARGRSTLQCFRLWVDGSFHRPSRHPAAMSRSTRHPPGFRRPRATCADPARRRNAPYSGAAENDEVGAVPAAVSHRDEFRRHPVSPSLGAAPFSSSGNSARQNERASSGGASSAPLFRMTSAGASTTGQGAVESARNRHSKVKNSVRGRAKRGGQAVATFVQGEGCESRFAARQASPGKAPHRSRVRLCGPSATTTRSASRSCTGSTGIGRAANSHPSPGGQSPRGVPAALRNRSRRTAGLASGAAGRRPLTATRSKQRRALDRGRPAFACILELPSRLERIANESGWDAGIAAAAILEDTEPHGNDLFA